MIYSPSLEDEHNSLEDVSCSCTTGSFAALVLASSPPTVSDVPTPRPGFMKSPEVQSLSEKQRKAKEKAQNIITLLKSKR